MENVGESSIVNDNVFHKTTEFFVEISEQEKLDNFLDDLNQTKAEFRQLFDVIEKYIEDAVKELGQDLDRKGLILRSEYLKQVVHSTKKLMCLIRNGSKKMRLCFTAEMSELELYIDDITELITDIKVKNTDTSQIDGLLDKFKGF